ASRCFARTVCRNLVLQCLARLRVFKHLHFTVTAPMINGQISDDGIQPSNVWREVRVTASYAGLALALDPPSLSFSNQIVRPRMVETELLHSPRDDAFTVVGILVKIGIDFL